MTKKQLAIKLSKLESFSNPKVRLEQYPLDSEFASEILWKAYQDNNIKNKVVADLGCGPGILGYAALELGSKLVYFVDIDKDALKIAKINVKSNKAKFVNTSVDQFNKKVNTVIQNPPYGTKSIHADKIFLETAFNLSNKVYSVHKLSSINFMKAITIDHNFNIKEIIKCKMPLKQTLPFHKNKITLIEIGCWVLESNQ